MGQICTEMYTSKHNTIIVSRSVLLLLSRPLTSLVGAGQSASQRVMQAMQVFQLSLRTHFIEVAPVNKQYLSLTTHFKTVIAFNNSVTHMARMACMTHMGRWLAHCPHFHSCLGVSLIKQLQSTNKDNQLHFPCQKLALILI